MLYFSGYQSGQGREVLVGKYNIEQDSIEYLRWPHPQYPIGDFVTGLGLLVDNDRLFVYGGLENVGSQISTQRSLILEFDLSLNLVDVVTYSVPFPGSSYVLDMIKRTNGNFLVAVGNSQRGVSCEPYLRPRILEYDSNFNIVDSYFFPDDEFWYVRMRLYEDENEQIFAHAMEVNWRNFEPGHGFPCISTALPDPRIVRFTPDLEREWVLDITRPQDGETDYIGFGEILPAQDEEGMVVVYTQSAPPVAEDQPETSKILTHMVKFSNGGDLLWRRAYSHFDSSGTNNRIYDFKPSPDGGFIMVGETGVFGVDPDNDTLGLLPYQQGWIIKVDESGCLIPGCDDFVSSYEELIDAIEPDALVFPNPVDRDLYFLTNLHGTSIQAQIFNEQGQLMRSWENLNHFTSLTHSISVDGLSSGIYYLSLRNNLGNYLVKPFIKQ
ncbi:MAG: T9SS type A sorting domain-containing protein [Bacteroidota bacterium]